MRGSMSHCWKVQHPLLRIVVIYLSCLLPLVPMDIFLIWYMEKDSMRQYWCRLRMKTFNLKHELVFIIYVVINFFFGKVVHFESPSQSEMISLTCLTFCLLCHLNINIYKSTLCFGSINLY